MPNADSLSNVYSGETLDAFRAVERTGQADIINLDPKGVAEQITLAAHETGQGEGIVAAFLPLTTALLASNQSLCAPLVASALAGDEEARAVYLRNRIVHFNSLPDPVKRVVEDQAAKIYSGLNANDLMPADVPRELYRKVRSEFGSLPPWLSLRIDELGFKAFYLYPTAQGALKYFDEHPNVHGPFRWTKDGLVDDVRCGNSLSPATGGAIGACARKIWHRCIPVMFAGQFLTDVLRHFEVTLKPELRMRLLESVTSPWDICDHLPVKNLTLLVTELETKPDVVGTARDRLIAKCLFDPEPLRRLRQLLSSSSRPLSPLLAPTASALEQPSSSIPSSRVMFVSAVTELLIQHGLEPNEATKVSRGFYAVHKRGGCRFAQIVSEVQAGNPPLEVLHRFREGLRADFTEEEHTAQHPEEMHARDEEKEPETEGYVLQSAATESGRLPYDAWVKTLGETERRWLESRMRRVQAGHLGDYRLERPGVFALRLFGGKGLRVYFAIEGKSLLLLGGGDKGSQDGDITAAYELLLRIRRSR